jgi:hypothetical protein
VTDASLQFVLKHQDANGAWRDFQAKPGRSDAWVTAYIGLKLSRTSETIPALERAAQFIVGACRRDGWGYNAHCAADADSTAYAILFLESMGYSVKPSAYAALAKFQRPCGGFATYPNLPEGHGWGRVHPDVPAVAVRALMGVLTPDHERIGRGLKSLPREYDSYWWGSPYYLPVQLLLLGCESGCEPSTEPADCFDQALALEHAVLAKRPLADVLRLAEALESRREADGSWPSAPILRITDPSSLCPGDDRFRASPLVADDRRLFTTATAAAALALAATRLRAGIY